MLARGKIDQVCVCVCVHVYKKERAQHRRTCAKDKEPKLIMRERERKDR